MSDNDDRMSTQVIDCAELDNLENISEVFEFLNSLDEANSPETSETTENRETFAENSIGCHSQHNQQDRLSPSRHSVDTQSTLDPDAAILASVLRHANLGKSGAEMFTKTPFL